MKSDLWEIWGRRFPHRPSGVWVNFLQSIQGFSFKQDIQNNGLNKTSVQIPNKPLLQTNNK